MCLRKAGVYQYSFFNITWSDLGTGVNRDRRMDSDLRIYVCAEVILITDISSSLFQRFHLQIQAGWYWNTEETRHLTHPPNHR